ncbi:hypothetical protein PGT21_002643 [Puccinia graminis f. sp. tritici]|uniref:Uncharacterized protein n=1 Tax=Puccinia graminis f. sp. tritici TaxID=56615 RepID=A0A5B0MDQ7_PUCGR|nr:hypothetical protein PGTUg99_009033 [Puccinia graminis f. sp. tritici]KAA1074359.1 hypothetical protein PGT21_002643 [Puccinia graminis f. sp. tritici]
MSALDLKEGPHPRITNPHNQLLILASLSVLPSCDRRPDETFNLRRARHDFSRMMPASLFKSWYISSLKRSV